MDNALYVGLSRQITLRRELDIIANNVANANTTGFKVEGLLTRTEEAAPARTMDAPGWVRFVLDDGVARNFSQGALYHTSNPFDLGIDGHIGEMLLNHTLGKIASTYIHTQAMQQRRAALEKWHAWLDGIGFGAIHGLKEALSEIPQNPLQPANGVACGDLSEFVIGEDSKA